MAEACYWYIASDFSDPKSMYFCSSIPSRELLEHELSTNIR